MDVWIEVVYGCRSAVSTWHSSFSNIQVSRNDMQGPVSYAQACFCSVVMRGGSLVYTVWLMEGVLGGKHREAVHRDSYVVFTGTDV